MLRVSLTPDSRRRLAAGLRKASDSLVAGVARAITQAALNVDHDAKVAAAVDTGRLRSSLKVEFAPGGLAASVGVMKGENSIGSFGLRTTGCVALDLAPIHCDIERMIQRRTLRT